MMKKNNLLLVSRCLSCRKEKTNLFRATFHFQGVLKGKTVASVSVRSPSKLQDGEDYLLHLGDVRIVKDTLFARILKARNLNLLKELV